MSGGASNNTALGYGAGYYTPGSNNTLIGYHAGYNLTSANSSNNMRSVPRHRQRRQPHSPGRPRGAKEDLFAGISGSALANGVAVMVNNQGRLGWATSSARCKEAIKPMGRQANRSSP